MMFVQVTDYAQKEELRPYCEFHPRNKHKWRLNLMREGLSQVETVYACTSPACVGNWLKELLGDNK